MMRFIIGIAQGVLWVAVAFMFGACLGALMTIAEWQR